MKISLLVGVAAVVLGLTGCETVVQTRRPVVYGTVYHRPTYYRDYYAPRQYGRNSVVVVRSPTTYYRRTEPRYYHSDPRRHVTHHDSRRKKKSHRDRDD